MTCEGKKERPEKGLISWKKMEFIDFAFWAKKLLEANENAELLENRLHT